MLKLHVVPAEGEPFDFSLDKETIVIGRSSASDLVIHDRFLSRRHARLFREGEQLKIEDLGARNGTFVNHSLVEKIHPIVAGDEIKLAGSLIRVYDSRLPLPTPPPSQEISREISLENASIIRPAAELLQKTDPSGGKTVLGAGIDIQRYAERLHILLDVHSALGSWMRLDELLELILDRVFTHLRPEQAVIYLKQDGEEHQRAAAKTLPGVREQIVPARSLVREVSEKGVAALVVDVEADERFAQAQSIMMSGVRSLLAAPLLEEEGRSLGMIVVSTSSVAQQFQESDMELLVALGSVAALRIRNAALAEEALERRRLEEELALARRIQETLLPQKLPEVPGFELYGGNTASWHVSGDYYQIIGCNDGKTCMLLVADVSGHGMAASLLTASFEALAAGMIEDGRPPEEICTKVSRRLYRRTPPERYATAFVVRLDLESGKIDYANAGHNQGLLISASGEVEELGSTGMPVGLVEESEYGSGQTSLQPGDALVIYTDGITETFDPDGEQFGLERLVEACRRTRSAPLDDMVAAIHEDLDAFARGVPFADDRTLVIARRLAE